MLDIEYKSHPVVDSMHSFLDFLMEWWSPLQGGEHCKVVHYGCPLLWSYHNMKTRHSRSTRNMILSPISEIRLLIQRDLDFAAQSSVMTSLQIRNILQIDKLPGSVITVLELSKMVSSEAGRTSVVDTGSIPTTTRTDQDCHSWVRAQLGVDIIRKTQHNIWFILQPRWSDIQVAVRYRYKPAAS